MDIVDALLCVVLAARIHKTNEAVRYTAKRCAKQLSKLDREIMFIIINSRSPLQTAEGCLQRIDLNVLIVEEVPESA